MDCLKIGQRIRLIAKSLKGKNRIREHGDVWTVTDVRAVACKDGKEAALLYPVNSVDSRWVALQGDADFEICEHKSWRWLDCIACKEANQVCDVMVCIDCGEEMI